MGEYGWGEMMRDYTFLEEIGRKVNGWGDEIARGGYMHHGRGLGARGAKAGGMRGRGRGGAGGGGGGGQKTKRDIFKMQLDVRDIDVELLPLGMKRRKANQSSWDFKKQTGLLTIEFKFHKPRNPLAPSSQPDDPPLTLLTHRNRMDASLLTILQTVVKERSSSKKGQQPNEKSQQSCLEWLQSLILPTNSDDPEGFTPPDCVMAASTVDLLSLRTSILRRNVKTAYHKLDVNQPLATALRDTRFVEFPTIEVWEEFKGAIVDLQGRVNQLDEEDEPPMKRRRLDKKTAKERISGLLGGYGSDESEEEDEKEAEEKKNVLSLLGDYSDGEEEDGEVQETAVGTEDAGELSGNDEDEEGELEPAALLELLRQVKKDSAQWAAPDLGMEDDVLEWGDLSDADAEGEDDTGHEEEE